MNMKDALEILGLKKRWTIRELRGVYRDLLVKWHPDRGQGAVSECEEMTQKIVRAYRRILFFSEEHIIEYDGSEKGTASLDWEEFWEEHFGRDPLWGG